MKIAVDAMGGDFAPDEIVKGVELARDNDSSVEFILYGQTDRINQLLKNKQNISVVQADEVIAMEDEPVKAVRQKKNSSLVMAAQAVKDQEADAFFSAGNTGAVLAAGLFVIGRIKGIDRPGLTTTLPVINTDNGQFVMLDVGANADTKPANMYQYALMGKFYAENVMHINNPRVGLLNNGTEADKGDMNHRKVHDLLAENADLNFIGNVESRDLLNGVADVVVTDGFTGNAVLKGIEGTALAMMKLLKSAVVDGGLKTKLGALMLKDGLKGMANQMDYSKHGGAVLLGLNAPVVKTHGSSKAETVSNTMAQIKVILDSKLVEQLKDYVTENKERLEESKMTTKK
ncbi:phosphate acyltransferase PlsX [Lentilactobacillus senioris]|uniref:phosphate acyltransferase PlsX n=1 Tax=Lentilactobacillus senioris TaxID=931534 RepID=UPI00227F173D|nr:phosphate acyltransferase PlsX [Lentilactobacillus senioris]MCY9806887.1 phosphate acyltransferase PlsX [Lentilactobacillus senioris]